MDWVSARDRFSFVHELGHILGANHNRKEYDKIGEQERISKDAFGSHFNNNKSASIMAYNFTGATRVNYFSGPDIYDRNTGLPTGTDTENNAANIRQNRFAVADFGNESDTSCNVPPPKSGPFPSTCPAGLFGTPPSCTCVEDNTDYYPLGGADTTELKQPSQQACQETCANNPECMFWTFYKKGESHYKGLCLMKSSRGDEKTGNEKDAVSGAKNCSMPDEKGNVSSGGDIGVPESNGTIEGDEVVLKGYGSTRGGGTSEQCEACVQSTCGQCKDDCRQPTLTCCMCLRDSSCKCNICKCDQLFEIRL